WPAAYGGRDLTPRELAIFSEELALSRAPRPANVIGLEMIGPTILSHGTEGQKKRYLPPLLSGEEIWCQGFTEPGSGSDMASLRTRATADEVGWRINGQKVWTSFAHEARWCMLLARTSEAGHRGLTCVLVDMHQPGVRTRQIPQITGDAEFNEVFFDDAVVGADDVLGEVGGGWQVAITTLMHERANLAIALAVDVQVALLELLALIRGRELDPILGDRLAQLAAECEVLRTTAILT
ncbi:MAG: acyl-CoA dehydrogenase, partial [Actinophytocola sp.]|nr:acyl-CoA dehydrogenase [Actinophytocola sp.]